MPSEKGKWTQIQFQDASLFNINSSQSNDYQELRGGQVTEKYIN